MSTNQGKPTRKRAGTWPQAGILNRPPEHLLLVALTLTGDAVASIERLRAVVRRELTSDLDEPGAETGELGFADGYDRQHLTVTVGLSSSGFDKLAVTGDHRPQDLQPVPWAEVDPGAAIANPDSGDVVLQICADSAYVAEHVLRRVEEELADAATVVWAHTGAQRYSTRAGRTSREEGRAWIGFKDGTHNLSPRHDPADWALTFVDPDPSATGAYPKTPPSGQAGPYGPGNLPVFPPGLREHPGIEPSWTAGGTYMTVRVSENDLKAWDSTPLAEQERIIGRSKATGAALDLPDDGTVPPDAPPAFAADPSAPGVELAAHIRKANPRAQEDAARRIFRRGYPLYEGGHAGLRRGLIFICFARTISTQFEFITRAWLNNPDFPRPGAGRDLLAQFDRTVLAGGYYFVPPLANKRQPWSWVLPDAP